MRELITFLGCASLVVIGITIIAIACASIAGLIEYCADTKRIKEDARFLKDRVKKLEEDARSNKHE